MGQTAKCVHALPACASTAPMLSLHVAYAAANRRATACREIDTAINEIEALRPSTCSCTPGFFAHGTYVRPDAPPFTGLIARISREALQPFVEAEAHNCGFARLYTEGKKPKCRYTLFLAHMPAQGVSCVCTLTLLRMFVGYLMNRGPSGTAASPLRAQTLASNALWTLPRGNGGKG